MRHLAGVLVPVAALGCGATTADWIARGEDLFHSQELSGSRLNLYTCETCHDVSAGGNAIKPGAPLGGVTLRPSFWGGQVGDLLEAVEECRADFMGDTTRLSVDDERAIALYRYLESLEPTDTDPMPFTTERLIDDPLPRGDAAAGRDVYERACAYCHGALGTAEGALAERVTLLPDQAVAEHAGYTPRLLRLVFIEKVRHGKFYGYGGDMPPFSIETLSDEQLSDLLEALGVLGTAMPAE